MFQTGRLREKDFPSRSEVSEARFKHFLKEMEAYEKKLHFERTLDSFLDLYSIWKRSRDPAVKLRLVMLAFELHRLNPDFQCDLFFPDTTVGTLPSSTGRTEIKEN